MKPRPRRYRWLDGITMWNSYSVAQGAAPMSDTAFRVAVYLFQFTMKADGSGIRVSQAAIGRDLDLPIRTVENGMRRLRDLGVIVRVKGHNRRAPAEYRAVITPEMYGFGADSPDLVPTAGGGYEPVDDDLVPTAPDLVPTARRSRTHRSPSREQMNSKNRSADGSTDPERVDPLDAITEAYCDGCGQDLARAAHRRGCDLEPAYLRLVASLA